MVKVEVTKQARGVLAGALIGTVLGALAAMLLSKRKRPQIQGGKETRAAAVEQELPLGQLAALVWHAFGLIREIADFGRDAE